jgi:fibronectin-binding autotransporter adhesin
MKSVISSLILGTLTGLSLISGAHAAQFTWWGGDADDLTETNWDIGIGIPVAILFSNSDITTDLYFGQYRDWDGIVRMDGFLHVDSLNFSGQNWDVNLSSLHMVTGDINVSSTSSVVNLNLVYGMSWGSAFGDGEMTINVDTGSQLNINGNAYGNGSLNKYGGGTTIITSPFNQERGSRIDGTNLYGGTLITDNPINDYNIREGTLLGFNIPNGWARGDLTFTSRIYGAGNFVKRGDATLTLAGDTSYTGFTTVEGGRLVISGSHYFSSGFIFDGGDLELRTTANTTYNSMINGTRSFTKSGIGTLTLTANNNYVGGVVSVTGGRLIESRPMGSNYNVTGNGELIFEVSSGSRNYSGALSGNAAFGKRGDGDLVISGTNTFTGATRIYDGRLFVDNLRGSYQIYSGSSLIFTQPSGANNLTYSGKIAGAGDLVKRGSGTLALTGDPGPDSDWSGTVRIEGGRLVDHHMRGDYVLGGSDAELEWVVDDWLSIINAGLPAELGIVGSISGTGNFTKSGSGTLVLFTKLNHSGDTKISGGVLVVLENNTLPTSTNLTVSGDGTFMSGALRSHTIGSLSGSGSVILPTSTLTINSQKDATFSGVISDSTSQAGVVIKNGAGTQTFSGVNTYVGGTYINSGRLIDHNPHGNYVLSNGSNLEFANNEFLSIDTANKVTGNGHFTKSGAGGLYLESALGHSGRTTINEGLLVAGVWNALPTSTDLTVGTNGTYLSGFRTNQTIGSSTGLTEFSAGTPDGASGSASTGCG